ncbi:MAG: type II toxin-antitoxin system PemK/MazF family toxin [Bacteroidetes bacterium]|nr:type II toxin-antitoxin system PemK/MazF family toxin [Bacteroidota bacterium]
MKVNQFEVVRVNLDPTVGKEMKKDRPCVVISPNELNYALGTVIIAPITTTARGDMPWRPRCTTKGTSRFGEIVLDQLRVIDKEKRIIKFEDELDRTAVLQVKRILAEMFN